MSARTLLLLGVLLFLAACSSSPSRGLPEPNELQVKGQEMLQGGDPAAARELFKQAARQGGDPFLANVGLARCSIAQGSWALMRLELNAAMATAPRTPEAYDLLGRTLLEAAKSREGSLRRQYAALAGHFFSQARIRAPELPGLTYHAGLTQYLAGRVRRAVAFYERALNEEPVPEALLPALAGAYRQLGYKKRMVALLEPLEEQALLTPSLAEHLAWAREGGQEPASRPRSGT